VGHVRRYLVTCVVLSACARDGAADGVFEKTNVDKADAGAVQLDADTQGNSDSGPPDAEMDAEEPIVDAGPRAVGEPCAADAQCDNAACTAVQNGGRTVTLCTHPCGLFQACTPGTACYDDGKNRLCVKACSDAAPECPPGLTCVSTYPPEKGCIPRP